MYQRVTRVALSIVISAAVMLVPVAAHAAAYGIEVSGSRVVGSTLTVKATFTNTGGAGTYVLDTEVSSPNGIRIKQFAESVWLSSGQTVTRSYSLPTTGAVTGTYWVSKGVFTQNWGRLVSWSDRVASFTLQRASQWQLTASYANANVHSTFVVPYSGTFMLDTEIYDSSNARVLQRHESRHLDGGQSSSFDIAFAGQAGKSYSVRQGAFSSDWSQLLIWSSDSTKFSVATIAPTTSTTVPTATVSTTPPTSTSLTPTSQPPTSQSPATGAPTSASGNPLSGMTFYGTNNGATTTAQQWSSSRSGDADLMRKLAAVPSATWLGAWSGDVGATAKAVVDRASAANKTAVFVAYNVPQRDCGNYSAGGQSSASGYNSWISALASGLQGRRSVVVLEPDALGVIDCLSSAQLNDRYAVLSTSVTTLKKAGANVYIDASAWVDPSTMANRLKQAGIAQADGFSVNVSGYKTTASMNTYGAQVSAALGGKHYVIDTSRNGNGDNGEWCNPTGRAVGQKPTTATGSAADAYLWLKTPGESDGTCNGGPSAGTFWSDYALGLVKAAGW